MKIGIPVLNRGDLLLKLVDSVDVSADILVVVNSIGPVDASVEEAVESLERRERPGLRVQVERISGNLGVSGSWNLIMDRFDGDCVISNSDIVFAPGVLQQAMATIGRNKDIVMHHLWAAACFYVTPDFTSKLGWFDENFYPAYHEDQEMGLRSVAMGVRRICVPGIGKEGIMHAGSQSRKNATKAVQTYIGKANAINGAYLNRRWGALPPRGRSEPEKKHPFDDPSHHPAEWTLDLDVRAKMAAICKEVTGFDCPIVYYRAEGGLG